MELTKYVDQLGEPMVKTELLVGHLPPKDKRKLEKKGCVIDEKRLRAPSGHSFVPKTGAKGDYHSMINEQEKVIIAKIRSFSRGLNHGERRVWTTEVLVAVPNWLL